eukprot:CAMPEP_0172600344 /NCGR_PEP_ID=MMETSP1068-20121228/20528_1 /TAXON_ID=35684 /ORGANISM="Pseudopedinella elastica, Strain CCMP716" /LENGTH=293 /DNA_ID=CAMNT_0013400971 /DNA_START=262 /DNA_END=1139 /DNA_ORIENTATION=-
MLRVAALLAFALEQCTAGSLAPLKATRRERPFAQEKKRVANHLTRLLAKAPAIHRERLSRDILLESSAPTGKLVHSWYGYPLTLDWIVDAHFSKDEGHMDPTSYPLILDSGSSNLAIAIQDCVNCGEAATSFNPNPADPAMCIEVEYGSGSWSGVEAQRSYVSLGGQVGCNLEFAGITSQADFFEGGQSYVGILGMAYQGIASSYSQAACDELAAKEGDLLSARQVPVQMQRTPLNPTSAATGAEGPAFQVPTVEVEGAVVSLSPARHEVSGAIKTLPLATNTASPAAAASPA